jgi:hypothetical protein
VAVVSSETAMKHVSPTCTKAATESAAATTAMENVSAVAMEHASAVAMEHVNAKSRMVQTADLCKEAGEHC